MAFNPLRAGSARQAGRQAGLARRGSCQCPVWRGSCGCHANLGLTLAVEGVAGEDQFIHSQGRESEGACLPARLGLAARRPLSAAGSPVCQTASPWHPGWRLESSSPERAGPLKELPQSVRARAGHVLLHYSRPPHFPGNNLLRWGMPMPAQPERQIPPFSPRLLSSHHTAEGGRGLSACWKSIGSGETAGWGGLPPGCKGRTWLVWGARSRRSWNPSGCWSPAG